MNNRVKVNELENSYDQWKSGTVTVKISQHDSTQSETHQLVNFTAAIFWLETFRCWIGLD